MNLTKKNIRLIIAGLILLIIFLAFAVSAIKNQIENNNTDTDISQTGVISPTPVINRALLQSAKTIDKSPRLLPREGTGIDINSPYVLGSATEIKKLSSMLPYTKSFTSSKNINVEVVIPPVEIMDNNWTLVVNIEGIDYMVPEGDPAYDAMKKSFLEGAQDVFYWLKSNNIATENIIIQWGDRAFVQERSIEWLNN